MTRAITPKWAGIEERSLGVIARVTVTKSLGVIAPGTVIPIAVEVIASPIGKAERSNAYTGAPTVAEPRKIRESICGDTSTRNTKIESGAKV